MVNVRREGYALTMESTGGEAVASLSQRNHLTLRRVGDDLAKTIEPA
jgi:hypothetical protein